MVYNIFIINVDVDKTQMTKLAGRISNVLFCLNISRNNFSPPLRIYNRCIALYLWAEERQTFSGLLMIFFYSQITGRELHKF